MSDRWRFQDARNRFSDLVDKALKDGPQVVTRRGREAVVVMSVEQYSSLLRRNVDLVDFFRRSPLSGLDFERSKDTGRDLAMGGPHGHVERSRQKHILKNLGTVSFREDWDYKKGRARRSPKR